MKGSESVAMKIIRHYSDLFKIASFVLLGLTPVFILIEGCVNGMAVLWLIPFLFYCETNPRWQP